MNQARARMLIAEIAERLSELERIVSFEPSASTEVPPDAIPLGPRIDPVAIGFSWMQGLLGFNIQPVSSMRDEYRWIGGQPLEDRVKVGQVLATDPWVQSHRGMCTARHIVRFWGRYLEPPAAYTPPKDFRTMREDAKAEQLRAALARFDAETAAYLDKHGSATDDQMAHRADQRLRLERSLS